MRGTGGGAKQEDAQHGGGANRGGEGVTQAASRRVFWSRASYGLDEAAQFAKSA
jgi:hypothetical protein